MRMECETNRSTFARYSPRLSRVWWSSRVRGFHSESILECNNKIIVRGTSDKHVVESPNIMSVEFYAMFFSFHTKYVIVNYVVFYFVIIFFWPVKFRNIRRKYFWRWILSCEVMRGGKVWTLAERWLSCRLSKCVE